MRPRRPVLGLVLAALLTPLAAQTEDTWDQGYDALRALMQQGKWNDAQKALEALLVQHKGQPFAVADRQSVIADHQQCLFWAQAKTPAVATLLSGIIEKHDTATGRIKLRYRSGQMSDWQERNDGVLRHPMLFTGAYTITLSGKAYPEGSLGFIYDLGAAGYYRVDLGGAEQKSQLARFDGDKETVLGSRPSPAYRPGNAYRVVLKVDAANVEVLADGKSLWKQKRDAREGSYFGLTPGNYDEVVLEGPMEPSWFQNLVDEQMVKDREEFNAGYDREKALPAWLFEQAQIEPVPERHTFARELGKSDDALEVLTLVEGRNWKDALEKLQKLGEKDFAPADRSYLEGLLLLRTGDGERALPLAQAAHTATPERTFVRVLLAEVLVDLRRPAEALPLLQQAHTDDPGNTEALQSLFVLLLRQGNVRAAERLVRTAKTKHGLWEDVFDLDRMLAMRRRGPAFAKLFTAQSAHYEVQSDIDKKICEEAVKVLEESYASLRTQFADIPDQPDAPRFRVYLFAGESGYQDYNSQILGTPVPHSAGLYTPVLKQLLIWNVPKREDMVRTIRHEGFHQFLDRVMLDPPVWLNEGMAEFWERAKREGDKFVGGQPRPDHVATLVRSRKAIPKLKDFVYGSRADFYRNAQQRYAQGWAVVQFLRKGSKANQAIFDTLFAALRSGEGSSRAALDKAFAGVDWDKLDGEWWAFVDAMTKAK